MDRTEFKKRMLSLKSYRENNPGKGYWDWKVELFDEGGEIDNNTPMWLELSYSGPTYNQILELLKKDDPAAYNRLAEARARALLPNSEIVRYVDANGNIATAGNAQGLQPVLTPEDLPGIGDAAEVYNIGKDVVEGNYGFALAGLGLLAIPGGAAGKIYRSIKNKYGKLGLVRAIYNNIAPGSYYDSYIPGGSKKTEIKNALKDYVLGKGDKIDPKWVDWLRDENVVGSFISGNVTNREQVKDIILGARQEAWMNYLGIPHEDKYLINTGAIENGMPVYRSNVAVVPNLLLLTIANKTEGMLADKQFTFGDYINSTGGNVGVSYNDLGNLRHITVEDIWDLNPFKDANRARILPLFVRNMYAHIEVLPDGYKKWVWNSNAPKWLTELEPSKILHTPGPFLNRTNINAKKLTKELRFKYKTKSKSEFVNDNVDIESNLWEFDNPEDYDIAVKSATEKYSKLYDELLKNDPDRLRITIPKDKEELLNQYGLFVRYANGGEVPPSDYQGSNEPARVNPITGKPLANGAVTPVLDLEGATNFTPVGDVLSIRDMYVAARNRDLLGLGLAGLGILPFMSRIRPIDRPPIPTVNKDAIQRLIDLSVSQTDKNKRVLDDFYDLRNRVYESLIENEDAFRRAARADRRSGTSYMLTYLDMVREYGRDGSNLNPNLAQPGYDRSLYEQPIKAQVSTSNPDLIRLNPRYKDPEELDETFLSLNPGLIRHEMGHSADIKSGLGYTKNLADPSKFEPESKIKEMYPKSYKTILDYLLNGSEIKSHMNEFRDFLFNKGEYLPKETINSIRKKLDKYGSSFKNLNILFDLYKNKRLFVNDYNLIPITATENNDNLV